MNIKLIALVAVLVLPGPAISANDPIVSDLLHIHAQAEKLSELADNSHPDANAIDNCVMTLTGMVAGLMPDISQFPDSASDHADILKAVALDIIRIGAAELELAGDGGQNALVSLTTAARALVDDSAAVEWEAAP